MKVENRAKGNLEWSFVFIVDAFITNQATMRTYK